MLSNKNIQYELLFKFSSKKWQAFLIIIFILITLIPSCGDKKEEEQKPIISFSDSVMIKSETKKLLGDNLKIALAGNFDEDSLQEIAALVELTENNIWGIKFVLLDVENNKLVKKYESDLLEGSFKESLVKKIKLPNFKQELMYYNSLDYFWGSGGGEVFAYLVDFEKKETFYAHLFSEARRPIELFLSKNITNPEIKKFFLSNFKKDYPDLRIASEDVSLEF